MPVEVAWLGHSCFYLRSGDTAVLMDPYSPSLGQALEPRPARVVTVSHPHPHHGYIQAAAGGPLVLRGPGEYEVAGVFIRAYATPLLPSAGEGGRNTVFVVEWEGLTLCHLGDLGRALTARQREAIGEVDVAFFPAGGVCTLSPREVRETLLGLSARLAVPMHYQRPGLAVSLNPPEPVLRELGIAPLRKEGRLAVSRASLPSEMQVVVLEASN